MFVFGESIEQKRAKIRLFVCVRLGAFLSVTKGLMSQNMTKSHNSNISPLSDSSLQIGNLTNFFMLLSFLATIS